MIHKKLYIDFRTKFMFHKRFLGQIGSHFGSDGSHEKQSDPQSDPRFFAIFKIRNVVIPTFVAVWNIRILIFGSDGSDSHQLYTFFRHN